MSKRSQELANDLARRAIAAAERRQRESGALDPDDLAQRLRSAAGTDGTLSVDEAVEALAGNGSPFNPFTDPARLERQAEKQRRDHERLFGPGPEPEDPPSKPEGDADGGQGEPETAVYEEGPHGRIRVWSEAELRPDNPKGT